MESRVSLSYPSLALAVAAEAIERIASDWTTEPVGGKSSVDWEAYPMAAFTAPLKPNAAIAADHVRLHPNLILSLNRYRAVRFQLYDAAGGLQQSLVCVVVITRCGYDKIPLWLRCFFVRSWINKVQLYSVVGVQSCFV